MTTKKTASFLLASTISLFAFSQMANASMWKPSNFAQRSVASEQLSFLPNKYHLATLDVDAMRTQLSTAARSGHTTEHILELPLPSGEIIQLSITDKSIMDAELSAKYPNIKTYSAQAKNDSGISGVIGINHLGFHAMLFDGTGKRIFVDRRTAINGQDYYISYFDSDYHPAEKEPFQCNVKGHNHLSRSSSADADENTGQRTGDSKRTYRIVIGATGEYTAFHGGTKANALSAINTTLARVNEMYERDLSVSMTLVSASENVIFTDSVTDPFTNNDPGALIDEAQIQIDALVGSENYDIGHVFSTGAGGLAGFGVVCDNSQKANGVTGTSNPQGDAYDIDFVSHEIGHQFGGSHTFNATTDSCGSGNRSATTAYEPGSGITIMAYAGICGATNDLENNSIAMFHVQSINQMGQFIDDTSINGGGSCGTATATGNSQPVVSAGPDRIIPVGTPFELTGSATDANNGDTLTYSWEQVDSGTASDVNVDTGDNAIFRNFLPVSTSNRMLPKLDSILAGTVSKGEILPTTARDINFALTVRDQQGGVGTDDVKVTVDNSGSAFAITSHNSASPLTAGTTTNVTWNAGNTAAAPINCTNVTILLSTDGGNTFPTPLVSATSNDGSQTVTIPVAIAANSTSRIKVACDNNIFFDISDVDLTVSAAVNVAPVATNGTLTATAGVAKTGVIAFSDANPSDTVTASIVTPPVKGTVTITNAATGAFTYTANVGTSGQDTFTFKANDGNLDSNTASVTITIQEPNVAPVASNGTLNVLENNPEEGALIFSDANSGDNHVVSIVTNGSLGVVNITNAATGAFTYTPNSNKNGTDSFTFKVNDGAADSNTATITVTISSTTTTPVTTPTSSGGGGSNSPFILFGLFLLYGLSRFKTKQ